MVCLAQRDMRAWGDMGAARGRPTAGEVTGVLATAPAVAGAADTRPEHRGTLEAGAAVPAGTGGRFSWDLATMAMTESVLRGALAAMAL